MYEKVATKRAKMTMMNINNSSHSWALKLTMHEFQPKISEYGVETDAKYTEEGESAYFSDVSNLGVLMLNSRGNLTRKKDYCSFHPLKY
jgi:hypothetical protein